MQVRPENGTGLRAQLARHEATGELPLGSHVNDALSRIDRYLQAVERLRPGRTATGRGVQERMKRERRRDTG